MRVGYPTKHLLGIGSEPLSTIPQALAEAALRFGTAEAVVDGDTRLTFVDLLDRVRTAARAYLAEGVEPGDRIAIWAPNTADWIVAALGAHYAGRDARTRQHPLHRS